MLPGIAMQPPNMELLVHYFKEFIQLDSDKQRVIGKVTLSGQTPSRDMAIIMIIIILYFIIMI